MTLLTPLRPALPEATARTPDRETGPYGRDADDAVPSLALGTALYVGALAASLVAPTLVDRWARRLPRAVAETAVTASMLGGACATVAALERARPYRARWNRIDGSERSDLRHLVVGGAVATAASSLASRPLGVLARRSPIGRRLTGSPLPARLAVSIVASELFHTSIHRVVHAWAPMWRWHSVHHGTPRLYWLNTTRFHPLEVTLVTTGDNLVLSALGIDPRSAVSHRVLRGVFGQIQHANVAIDSGPLNGILSTPERHRWHHSVVASERNSNFGSVLCLWDRALGTDFLPPGREMSGPLGVTP